jgi:hypothetical protein
MNRDRWHGRDRIDLGTELLDRQITAGADAEPVGKVDDLELTRREDGSLEVTALLVGVTALRARTPRSLAWVLRAGQRLTGGPNEPRRIGLDQVVDVRSDIAVTAEGAEAAMSPTERRLRAAAAEIPGADHEG